MESSRSLNTVVVGSGFGRAVMARRDVRVLEEAGDTHPGRFNAVPKRWPRAAGIRARDASDFSIRGRSCGSRLLSRAVSMGPVGPNATVTVAALSGGFASQIVDGEGPVRGA
jgi:hypothetical protein